jgi:predicted nucleotidyltransferase
LSIALVIPPKTDRIRRMIQRSKIRAFADAVARRFKPQRIVLFGSYAYGKPTKDSDVDLLVVMPEDRKEGRKAAQIREEIEADFPLDLIVRTPEDIRWRLAEGDCFLQEIFHKGQVMYEAAHA